jgi:hypothetical protein
MVGVILGVFTLIIIIMTFMLFVGVGIIFFVEILTMIRELKHEM